MRCGHAIFYDRLKSVAAHSLAQFAQREVAAKSLDTADQFYRFEGGGGAGSGADTKRNHRDKAAGVAGANSAAQDEVAVTVVDGELLDEETCPMCGKARESASSPQRGPREGDRLLSRSARLY